MGRLVYTALASLDGYIADAEGRFDLAFPDEEVHAFVNDLERPAGSYLYGRRLYEVMAAWETMPTDEATPAVRDFAERRACRPRAARRAPVPRRHGVPALPRGGLTTGAARRGRA